MAVSQLFFVLFCFKFELYSKDSVMFLWFILLWVCVCVSVCVLATLHLHCRVQASLAAMYVGSLVEVRRLSCM